MIKIKIACIGNMNNNMFCLVRYLRDKGYDAHLFLVDEFDHFLPGSDSYNLEYKEYTHQLDWYDIGHWKISPEKMRIDLDGFNFVICCDRVPAYLDKAKIDIDIFIPHGGDIFHLAFYKFKNFPPKKWEIGAMYQSIRQKAAIKNAKSIMYDITNDKAEAFIKRIKIRGERFYTSPPFIYFPQYYTSDFKEGIVYQDAISFRDKFEVIFMHQCRHVWKSDNTSLHFKANDVIIHGYNDFLKQNPNLSVMLVMFNYGWDAKESKKLVDELGISQHVKWLDLMNRKDLMRWVSICDIGIGEVGRSWLSYGSVYEILALSKPFIGRREDEIYLEHYAELYPMKSAKNSKDIKTIFQDYIEYKENYVKMGKDAHVWFKKHAIDKPLDIIIKKINNKNYKK